VIYGDGEQARDFTYIDDAVEANVRAAVSPERAAGRVLNVAGGRNPTSVNRLLAKIATEIGVEPRAVHDPPSEGDIRLSEADVSLGRDLIGYQPAVGIDEGIRRTVAWFRDHAPLVR
jgi:UDP-glucose 4-epimerase